ncbi:MAG: GH39 family glycosyl hydrolase, partial [Opitutaceae bacterium]
MVAALLATSVRAAAPRTFPVSIQVDAGRPLGAYVPLWPYFGYDEANYTTMSRGEHLLGELGAIAAASHIPIHLRCHNLLTSGDGVAAPKWSSTGIYAENAAGQPEFNWKIVDGIFDAYVARGLHPYVEIGFMPKALSIRPDLYPGDPRPGERAPIDGGQAYPPKSYKRWDELIHRWAEHCLRRYGAHEVSQWYWEVWNEPNILY